MNTVETTQTCTSEINKLERKKKLENTCKKVMAVVLPCLCILIVIGYIFRGSAEARKIRDAFRSEGFDVQIVTDSTDIKKVIKEFNPNIKNVDELVFAIDKEDEEIYAIVMFCESRLDAEDAYQEISWWLSRDPDSKSYTVERNAKAVCFGYVDLVETVMEILD